MLSIHKNKLINRLLQLEIAFNEIIGDEKLDDTLVEVITGEYTKNNRLSIIARNIQSIKKQINKL